MAKAKRCRRAGCRQVADLWRRSEDALARRNRQVAQQEHEIECLRKERVAAVERATTAYDDGVRNGQEAMRSLIVSTVRAEAVRRFEAKDDEAAQLLRDTAQLLAGL